MRRIAWLIGCLGVAIGCHQDGRPGEPASDDPAPAAAAGTPTPTPAEPPQAAAASELPPDPYRADLENLCDAMNRSGADQLQPGDRQLAIAGWLGSHIQTAAAHQFLVHIQPLQGMAKADALVAEAQRVGLASCALAAEWRGPNAVNPR